jgi:hypothetical protein
MDEAIMAYREALLRNASRAERAKFATHLEPDVVAWLELMRDLQRTTMPDPAFVARLAAQLASTPAPDPAQQPASPGARRVRRSHAVSMTPPAGRKMTIAPTRGARWYALRRAITSLTTVMLLLILVVGFMVLRLRIAQAPETGPWVPALVRALDGIPGVIDVPLAETTFMPADLPIGEKEGLYYQLTLPPDTSLPSLGAAFCGCRRETITAGVGVEVVQSGSYTLWLEAPLRVQRGGVPDRTEAIPARTEVTLTAGDVVIYPDYAASGEVRNTGATPVTLVGFAIVAAGGSGTPVPMTPQGVQATLWEHALPTEWATLPPGPLNLTLHQVTLLPGTSIAAYQPAGVQAIRITSGMISRNLIRIGDALPSGPPLVQTAGSTISSVLPDSRLQETLANTGTTPAALLVLIIEPAERGA